MLVDVFMYAGYGAEFDLIELRLKELAGVVDKHIAIELSETFSGLPKLLAGPQLEHRFRAYADRLSAYAFDAPCDLNSSWDREHFLRDCMVSACEQEMVDDTAIVITSDCDELPKPDVLRSIQFMPFPVRLKLDVYYYFANLRSSEVPEHGPVVAPLRYYRQTAPSAARLLQPATTILSGAWHFSYLGMPPETVKQKLAWFSHQELNCEPYNQTERIAELVRRRQDLFGRGFSFAVEEESKLPPTLREDRFRSYLL